MANHDLYDKQINDTLHLQFVRNAKEKESITWQTWLTNTRTKEKLMLDSYTLEKKPMYLGDPELIASGEDMIFHHDLANAIFIDKSLYIVHNMQGRLFLRKYTFTSGPHFTKDSFYLAHYFAVGALTYGYQYADFLQQKDDLFILVNADCEMAGRYGRPDWLFEFNRSNNKLSSITFSSIVKKDESLAWKLEIKDNPFVEMDIKSTGSADKIEKNVFEVLNKSRKNAVLKYWGALENIDSYNSYHFLNHLRSSGLIFFFYGAEKEMKIMRYSIEGPSNYWYIEDYIKTPLSGKEEK